MDIRERSEFTGSEVNSLCRAGRCALAPHSAPIGATGRTYGGSQPTLRLWAVPCAA